MWTRRGKLRAFVGLVAGAAFTVFLWALQEAEVIDTATAVYVAVVSGLLFVVTSILKLWLDRREERSDERPIIPPEMYFREDPEVLHRPSADAIAPHLSVARLGMREVVSRVRLEIRTNKPVEVVRANIYQDGELERQFERSIANLAAMGPEGVFGKAMQKATLLDKGIRWALLAFDDAVLATPSDNLDVIAGGGSEDLRIMEIRLVRTVRR